ncbi:MAG: hypothetical protein H6Q51_2924 [Deltaproteobacteria bacterium]|nr:hypothetical protein [Deltaproteobacteria bacterium]
MFLPFFQLLRDQGVPVSLRHVLELYEALEKGLAPDLDRLFILLRLTCVKKLEHFDAFEQTFAAYFLDAEHGRVPRFARDFWESKAFRRWLEEEVRRGAVAERDPGLRRFGAPFRAQGDRGSPVRQLRRRKVIEARRYVNYAAAATLRAENLRQALASLRHMVPAGPATELDVDETVTRSSRNGGEIELIFRRELRDRIQVVVLLDNGGSSMIPYVDLVKLVFAKMRDQFRDLDYYYFHNCLYGCVYSDHQRRTPYPLHQLLRRDPETRLIIIGDANMAPAELLISNGAIDYFSKVRVPGREWLLQLRSHFPRSVWLNPVPRSGWRRESSTITSIGQIFPMEDLTLSGIRQAVEWLNAGGTSPRQVGGIGTRR